MGKQISVVILFAVFFYCYTPLSFPQTQNSKITDTTQTVQPIYDPFGPENSPDHNGRGSGGVLTPSPYEGVVQSYYTKINADYTGVQFMLDSPLQISPGLSWSTYQGDIYGILLKVRSSGIREHRYNPVLEKTIPIYRLPFEFSLDYDLNNKSLNAFKLGVSWESNAKSLGMAGIGVIVSNWNLTLARDKAMNRKLNVEFSSIQVGGGYIMPLSPNVGGVNISVCGAVDLLGAKYQSYNSDIKKFYGTKIGSIGWLAGFGWNALSVLNLSFYVGGEWSFSTGILELPTKKYVRSDIGRNDLYFGMQFTGSFFNIIAGTQKEWEYLDYLKNVQSEKNLRYYLGINYYLRK